MSDYASFPARLKRRSISERPVGGGDPRNDKCANMDCRRDCH